MFEVVRRYTKDIHFLISNPGNRVKVGFRLKHPHYIHAVVFRLKHPLYDHCRRQKLVYIPKRLTDLESQKYQLENGIADLVVILCRWGLIQIKWFWYWFTVIWKVCFKIRKYAEDCMGRILYYCIKRDQRLCYLPPKIAIPTVIPISSPAIQSFKNDLRREGIQLTEINEKYEGMVMVICLNHSRLETNVDNALAKLKRSEYNRFFLVIVHSKPVTELPRECSKNRLMRSDKFKEIAEIVDMAFYKNQGIYKCDMNNNAVKTIRNMFSKT